MNLWAVGLDRPELIWLLALTPILLALLVLAGRARIRALRIFGGASALTARSTGRIWLKSALLLRGARRLGVDIVLAVDVSQSMATRDVEPDRLRAAQHVAQQLGERMVGSRVSLVLFHMEGLQYDEIAAKLGVSLGKVKTDIFRAREALRRKLRLKLGDEDLAGAV